METTGDTPNIWQPPAPPEGWVPVTADACQPPAPPEGWALVAPSQEPQAVANTAASAAHARRTAALSAVSAIGALGLALSLVGVFGSPANADGAVVSAIKSTLQDKTARVTETGSVLLNGHTIGLGANGIVDFTQNAADLHISETVAGQSIGFDEVMLGDTVYEEIPGISAVLPGKSWVSVDAGSAESSPTATGSSSANPSSLLHLLGQQGLTATALGTSTVDGQSVEGYQVTMDAASLKQQMSQANVPSWMRSLFKGISFTGGTASVYVNGSGELVRTTMALGETYDDQHLTSHQTVDYSDFGTPVSVNAPPSSEVAGIQQFLNAENSTVA